jgi:glycosyltransferase involved in cell wall biosynthesis
MAIYYIGSFPPSYGGVTVKNKNLYEALEGKLDVRKIDMNRIKRGDIREILRFSWAMLTGKQYIIGLAGQKNRRQFTKLLYAFKRRAMARSILLVMSGIVEDIIQAGPGYISKLNNYRRVYLEFPGMVRKLTDAGVTNADVYPNGRPRPGKPVPICSGNTPLRCVFFSQIEPEKGVDRILETAGTLPDIQFDFYGKIVPVYEKVFQSKISGMENVRYHGLFTGDSEAVYRELSQYDLLLLPTRCKTEGLPGILVEAKIAGLPAVISDINYNREIVADGADGFILAEDTAACLETTLRTLDGSRELLHNMKYASRESAENYYIDVCARDIISRLQER